MWFLYVYGDLDKDPLDHGVSSFESLDELEMCLQFVKSKELKWKIYRGQLYSTSESMDELNTPQVFGR